MQTIQIRFTDTCAYVITSKATKLGRQKSMAYGGWQVYTIPNLFPQNKVCVCVCGVGGIKNDLNMILFFTKFNNPVGLFYFSKFFYEREKNEIKSSSKVVMISKKALKVNMKVKILS